MLTSKSQLVKCSHHTKAEQCSSTGNSVTRHALSKTLVPYHQSLLRHTLDCRPATGSMHRACISKPKYTSLKSSLLLFHHCLRSIHFCCFAFHSALLCSTQQYTVPYFQLHLEHFHCILLPYIPHVIVRYFAVR